MVSDPVKSLGIMVIMVVVSVNAIAVVLLLQNQADSLKNQEHLLEGNTRLLESQNQTLTFLKQQYDSWALNNK